MVQDQICPLNAKYTMFWEYSAVALLILTQFPNISNEYDIV